MTLTWQCKKIALFAYSCIIVDISLPHVNGLDILRTLKKENKSDGIIIISAKKSIEDKVTGSHIGADDF
ncbi:MAG: response regulator [Ferruginibacter sp.]